MIVEVIVGDIGEDGTCKLQSLDPVLMDGVTAALHEHMGATGIHHAAQQRIEADGIGGRMGRRDLFMSDLAAYGRDQSGRMIEGTEETVQQGGDGRLSVGAGDADQFEVFGWASVEFVCHLSGGHGTVIHPNIGDMLADALGHGFADDAGSPFLHCHGNMHMPVGGGTTDGNKTATRPDFPGIDVQTADIHGGAAHDGAKSDLI